ncbi:MAG: hypothetical protein EAZ95_02080 [Bacteroidetes bacterium]|nr:MAG: hypothetical protein EAZ95_02080 [Bacteroidota bacterium]
MKKNTLLKAIFVLFCCVMWQNASAQILKGLFKNKLATEIHNERVVLNQADTTIVVPYTLIGYRNRYYTVKLSYSNNNGTSYKGPLRSVLGEVGDSIRPGKDKKIEWKFKKDNPYFDGKNISFKLEVVEKPKIAIGGPQNALRSLLMPGLGDTKVRNGYRYGWVAVGTYACLATGAYYTYQAQQTYKNHKNRLANNADDHNQYFKDARRYQTVATVFFATGATVWLGDVIGVYFRGLKNKRRIAREKEKLEAEKQETSSLRIIPYTDGNSKNVAFVWKF